MKLLDPTLPNDPVFDPDGLQAHRVRAAARRPLHPRRAPRRRLALGLATGAAAAAAVAIGTGTTSPIDARAALLEAAERTGAIESGRAISTLRSDHPNRQAEVRNEMRFQGDDLEIVSTGQETLPSGETIDRRLTFREVDGVAYQRVGDGEFRRIGTSVPPDRSEPQGGVDVPPAIAGQIANDQLIALVKAADDVTSDGSTYRGTVTTGQIEAAAPTTAGRPRGPSWDVLVKLEVTINDDGLIRRVVATGERDVKTTEFLDLGEPQVIERPIR
jgi:hypothetical protein